MDIVTLITLLTTLLAAIGVGLGMVWKYFTEQDAKKTEIILKQVEEAKEIAAEERKRADLLRSEFLEALDKRDKVSSILTNKRDKIMDEHLRALQELNASMKALQEVVLEKSNKERN